MISSPAAAIAISSPRDERPPVPAPSWLPGRAVSDRAITAAPDR
jgi:hypothetical protein